MKGKLWFKAKRYGWGWYPVTWQGWAIVAMYIFSLISTSQFASSNAHSGSDFLMNFFPNMFILTVFLIIICYTTGEEPRWQWGDTTKKDIEHDK